MDIRPQQIKQALTRAHQREAGACPPLPGLSPEGRQPAAVLIPLLQDDKGWNALFIKRTHQDLDRHSGQIAFPGGRSEPGDSDLLATALREAQEEVGTDPGDIQILGQSCTIQTVTDYEISPFVGILPWPYPLRLSTAEVEKTLTIPLAWLGDPHNYSVRSWESRSVPGRTYPVIFYQEYKGEILWGATARIVQDFLELLQQTG